MYIKRKMLNKNPVDNIYAPGYDYTLYEYYNVNAFAVAQ